LHNRYLPFHQNGKQQWFYSLCFYTEAIVESICPS
jgi:hypothetical protein